MNDIVFELQTGGLGRPLAGEDHYSAFLFYTGSLPSGFSSTDRVKRITSLPAAVSLGIKNDYSDATAATSAVTVTAVGAAGALVDVTVADISGTVTLAAGVPTDGADADEVAESIVDAINANTLTTGYSAELDNGVTPGKIKIVAPKSQGIFLNTKSPVLTETPGGSTFAATIVAFTGGVASLQTVWHYHISTFFAENPKGVLYVGFYAVPNPYTFTELISIQNYAAGKVRQFAVYKDGAALAFADVVALQAVCQTMITQHKETFAILGADISATADLTTLPDMSIRNSQYVTVDIGQDGGGLGAFLYKMKGKSITSIGALLGSVSLAKVNESVAWVGKFNQVTASNEFDVPALANGSLIMDANGVIDDNFLDALEAKSYTFLRKFVGDAGTYRNETRTCIGIDSDFAYVENIRTIQKAMRGVYLGLLPALGAPIVLNPDGTLQDHTIEYFKTLAEKNLLQMERDQEISSKNVEIDPTQQVLVNGYLIVSVEVQPVGVARSIRVPIGFTVKTNG